VRPIPGLVLLCLALLLAATSVAGAASGKEKKGKLTAQEFDRVQAAGLAALSKLGLVDERNCSRTDLSCLDAATSAEVAAFRRAVAVEREAARTLVHGRCKSAMRKRAASNAKHVSDVLKARRAWHARDLKRAARYYHADYAHGRKFDVAFVTYCS
jgi:hypothetical protein